MNSIELTYESRKLTVRMRKEPSPQISELVRDAWSVAGHMTASGQIPHGGMVGIYGAHPIAVAYVLSHALVHVASTIAVYYPQHRDGPRYVVCKSDDPDYPIGAEIDPDEFVSAERPAVLTWPEDAPRPLR
ncbi:MAG TPA: hypothetical protein VFC82_09625 [Actinomycetaceae bacterium]|nr:hypothetical protein [Actinomycetaceae bacterium]